MLETHVAHTHTWPHGSRTWLAWGVGRWGVGLVGLPRGGCRGEGAVGRLVVGRGGVRAPIRSRGAEGGQARRDALRVA